MSKKRVLSEFLCRELLYDYVCKKLDYERNKAVEDCLAESEDVRDDLRALNEGLKYCQLLQTTKISQPLQESLEQPPKGFKDYLESWKSVKAPIRLGVESLIVAIFVGIAVALIPKQYAPWSKTSSYTLVEINKEATKEESEVANISTVTTTTVMAVVAQPEASTTKTTYGPPTTLLAQKSVALAKSIFKMFPAPSPLPITTTTRVAEKKSTSTTLVQAQQKAGDAKGKGEIYRVYMSSSRVDEITPEMVEKILALGGEKAGEVQLGWKRQQGSYFHFSLPESNFGQLKSFMQNLGPVRIVREPHGRVMPPGTIRLILWLETTKGKKESTSEKNGSQNTQEDSQ